MSLTTMWCKDHCRAHLDVCYFTGGREEQRKSFQVKSCHYDGLHYIYIYRLQHLQIRKSSLKNEENKIKDKLVVTAR